MLLLLKFILGFILLLNINLETICVSTADGTLELPSKVRPLDFSRFANITDRDISFLRLLAYGHVRQSYPRHNQGQVSFDLLSEPS